MKYHIITYGCQMNKSDSERIAAVLESKNYKKSESMEGAGLIVVNMCSVRQSAVDRVLGLAQKFANLKLKNPNLKTTLTGCILKKDRKKFSNIFDQISKFEDLLKYQPKYQDNLRVFVPISNGCNNFCSYCVVPYARGKEISRTHKKIIKEIKRSLKSGAKEIWLLGQNVNSYKDPSTSSGQVINFPKLLKMVNDIPGNFKLNFLTSHPKDFSDELIKTMAKCDKLEKRLNLPIQSGDNQILKRMNRPYTVAQYKNLVGKIREAIPDISLSTDVIVGFPGETKKQFENTVKTFKEIGFDAAFINKYSPRPGTLAFKMENNVAIKEKKRREKILKGIIKNG